MGRPVASRWTAKRCLTRLPDEILILVMERCDIDGLLALRLTSRGLRSLIGAYESTIVQAVARTTFPDCKLILRPPDAADPQNDGRYSLQWLTGLIPKHLAAVIVDRHRYCGTPLPMLDGIPAEDEMGDEMRAHVAHGFRILEALSLIAQDVEETPDSKIESSLVPHLLSRCQPVPPSSAWHRFKPNCVYRRTRSALRYWRKPHESVEKKKTELARRRQDLVTALQCRFIDKRLTPEAAADFDAMWTILRMAFQHHRYFALGTSCFDWGKPDVRDVFRGDSWVNWFVFRAGASFWWKHYWVRRTYPNHVRSVSGWTEINQVWKERTREQMDMERNGATEVFSVMRHRMKGVDAIRLPTYDEYHAMVRSSRGDATAEPEDRLKHHCATMTLF